MQADSKEASTALGLIRKKASSSRMGLGALITAPVITAFALALGARAALATNATSAMAAPPPGVYGAQLCVALGSTPASCGPAEAELQADGQLRIQISDIVYRLQLRPGQVDVVLVQGSMQLDEFSAACSWMGQSLRFADVDKGARYELKLGTRQGAPK